jgi:integrase
MRDRLAAAGVRNAKKSLCDGAGLWLKVGRRDGYFIRSWTYRFMLDGRPREMGLGNFPDVTLAEAREAALQARRLVKLHHIDPIDARKAERAKARRQTGTTFRAVSDGYIAAHEAKWRNARTVTEWRRSLARYAFPTLGDRPVNDIETGDVMRTLEALWRRQPMTASRVRWRIESVLDYAAAHGWRSGANPAKWQGHLANLLPHVNRKGDRHHAALDWRQIGAFMAALRQRHDPTTAALQFVILTATRGGETRHATWRDMDFGSNTWLIPASRTKAGREHRVPLSPQAMDILATQRRPDTKPDDFVFPGRRSHKPLTDVSLNFAVKRLAPDATMHGMRSSFRDWAAETSAYDNHVIEMALGHAIGSSVEKAYRRGDLFEKRRRLMAEWATFCGRAVYEPTDGVVVSLHG